jgi:hypothetical protein
MISEEVLEVGQQAQSGRSLQLAWNTVEGGALHVLSVLLTHLLYVARRLRLLVGQLGNVAQSLLLQPTPCLLALVHPDFSQHLAVGPLVLSSKL